MWKLNSILALIISYFWLMEEGSIVIILDDCKNWEIMKSGFNDPQDFINSKEFPNNHSVIATRMTYPSTRKPEIWNLTKTEMEHEILYSSNLEFEDWLKLERLKGEKIFILMPEDYCSDKRFVYDYKFPFYEVMIMVTKEM